MTQTWLRPLTYFEHASSVADPNTGVALPALMGGPFPNDVIALCTGAYGPREPIWLPAFNAYTAPFHFGLDFWAPEWVDFPPPLLSLVDGVVTIAQTAEEFPPAGNWVEVRTLPEPEYPAGRWCVQFYHMRDAPTVKVGDAVTMGQQLGVVGMTGYATALHLHLQISDNTSGCDPLPLLADAPRIEKGGIVTKLTNVEAIQAFMAVVNQKDATIAQQDGCYVGVLEGAPAGYRDIVTRVKEA